MQVKRWMYAAWLGFIVAFGALYFVNLRADFPHHSPWMSDQAKYTDEGWWANAAARAQLTGNWYLPGDYNPALTAPALPAVERVVFLFGGVTMQAARGLAVAFFLINLFQAGLLLYQRSALWTMLLALTMLVTSPFFYAFNRLALLEPLLVLFALAAINLAIRLPQFRHPIWCSVGIGLIFSLMMLTKSTAIFLLPALMWACMQPLWKKRRLALSCGAMTVITSALAYGAWIAVLWRSRFMREYFYILDLNNRYNSEKTLHGYIQAFFATLYKGWTVDPILVPLAVVVILLCLAAWREGAGALPRLPAFGACALAVAGYFGLMMYHLPEPRYFTVLAFFAFVALAQGTEALLRMEGGKKRLGQIALVLIVVAVCRDSLQTLNYALHPRYSFVEAAEDLTQFIDAHPNGNRILVSNSGDSITLVTHLPALCFNWGTMDVASKLAVYQPGWIAEWNVSAADFPEAIRKDYSLERVASFQAFDHPQRNVLVLFKLHPIAAGQRANQPNRSIAAPTGTPFER
jgi:hypothetical protein